MIYFTWRINSVTSDLLKNINCQVRKIINSSFQVAAPSVEEFIKLLYLFLCLRWTALAAGHFNQCNSSLVGAVTYMILIYELQIKVGVIKMSLKCQKPKKIAWFIYVKSRGGAALIVMEGVSNLVGILPGCDVLARRKSCSGCQFMHLLSHVWSAFVFQVPSIKENITEVSDLSHWSNQCFLK